MRRLQIYIDEDLDAALATEAIKGKTSKAALIRLCVREHLAGAEGLRPAGRDTLDDLVGRYDEDPGSIDDLLYGS